MTFQEPELGKRLRSRSASPKHRSWALARIAKPVDSYRLTSFSPSNPRRSVGQSARASASGFFPRVLRHVYLSVTFRGLQFTKHALVHHMIFNVNFYNSFSKRKAPLLSVCLCFTPLEAERCASVASSPSLWPGGAPLSPGRSVFMPLASSNPPRQCMEPAPTQRPQAERQSGRTSA